MDTTTGEQKQLATKRREREQQLPPIGSRRKILNTSKNKQDHIPIESRDDPDQKLRQSKRSTASVESSRAKSSGKSSRPSPPRDGRPFRHQHQKNNPSMDTVHVESLRAERDRLQQRLEELKASFESIQKKKAYEKSSFLMKRGQLLVEIEGLQEDKLFLTRKKEKLSEKLLQEHTQRLHLMGAIQ